MLDAMIVVAALAVSFGMARASLGRPVEQVAAREVALTGFVTTVIAITPAALSLRLRPPRPRLRQLARQPGFAALAAASAVLVIEVLALVIIAPIRLFQSGRINSWGRPVLTPNPTWWVDVTFFFDGMIGLAVMGAWLLLALSGRRRPERHWLDYLGRGIGTAWIVLFVANACARLARLIE